MPKNFWLNFALNEALSVLTAYGTALDPKLAPDIQACQASIQKLLTDLNSGM